MYDEKEFKKDKKYTCWLENECNEQALLKKMSRLDYVIESKICDKYLCNIEIELFKCYVMEKWMDEEIQKESSCDGELSRVVESTIDDVKIKKQFLDCERCMKWCGFTIDESWLELISCFEKSKEPILFGRIGTYVHQSVC